jgi:hypothetical protein
MTHYRIDFDFDDDLQIIDRSSVMLTEDPDSKRPKTMLVEKMDFTLCSESSNGSGCTIQASDDNNEYEYNLEVDVPYQKVADLINAVRGQAGLLKGLAARVGCDLSDR